MYEPCTPGAPALPNTSPSPVASITTRPRMACRPDFVSAITPRTAPSSTITLENQEWKRSCTPASSAISCDTCFQPSGSKEAEYTMGLGFRRA